MNTDEMVLVLERTILCSGDALVGKAAAGVRGLGFFLRLSVEHIGKMTSSEDNALEFGMI